MEWRRSERRGSESLNTSTGALRVEWSALEEGQCLKLNSMKINSNESQTIIGELKAVGCESDD